MTSALAAPVGIRYDESQKYSMVYLESYFEQFHCYWPIIHRPSHEEEANETDLCELSMRMVGAWFLGTNEAVRFAVDTHVILLNHVMSQLV